MRSMFKAAVAALVISAGVAVVVPAPAGADTFTVTNTNNSGGGSLRAAVNAANANPGADVIRFAPGTDGTPIVLSSVIQVTDDLVIEGNGRSRTVVNGNRSTRVFETSGEGVSLRLKRLKVRGGRHGIEGGGLLVGTGSSVHCRGSSFVDNSVVGPGGVYGGGVVIANDGIFTARGCTFSGNRVGGSDFARGGGITNFGTLTLRDSTVDDNVSSGHAGGIYNAGGGLLVNATISGNRTVGNGGGIEGEVGSTLSVNNSTITRNQADRDEDETGTGGGLFSQGGITLGNSILAGNRDLTGSGDDCAGPLSSNGHNLIKSTSRCSISGRTGSNITGRGAKLGALAGNGGATRTHLPAADSPAVDSANPGEADGSGRHCARGDQRGVRRPKDGDGNGTARCDRGAVERRASD